MQDDVFRMPDETPKARIEKNLKYSPFPLKGFIGLASRPA